MNHSQKEMQYLYQQLCYWIPILVVVACCLGVSSLLLYPNQIETTWSDMTIWDWLNRIGARLGIVAVILLIAFPKIIPPKGFIISLFLGVISYFIIYFTQPDTLYNNISGNLVSMWAPVGLIVFGIAIYKMIKEKDKFFFKFYGLMFLLIACMGISTNDALNIVSIVLPNSYDVVAYKLDTAYGGLRQAFVTVFISTPNWFQEFIRSIYAVLSLYLFIIFALIIREGKAQHYHILRTFIVPFGVAFICYMIVPISGPIYAFGADQFPLNMPAPEIFKAQVEFILPNPRNGMPSMHYSGAFLIFLLSAVLSRRIYFYLASIFLALTITATIGLGEHYIIDLVVAMPFAIALGMGLMAPKGLFNKFSTRLIWGLAVATFAFWMISIISIHAWLADNIWFVRLLSLWSVGIAVYLTVFFLRFVWQNQQSIETSLQVDEVQPVSEHYPKWIIGAFVTSGFAGLLYEVVYAKSLAITFGSTSLASYTVLVTYMGGMALGAWIGGILADRVAKPLMYYVGIEAIIGIYAVLTPLLFKGVQALYLNFAVGLAPDAEILTVFRVALGALVLGIPTILMGATVPFMFKYLKQIGVTTESAVSKLYSANVVGASLGSLVAGYVLLPILGRSGATNLAAVISLFIALYALEQAKKFYQVELSTTATRIETNTSFVNDEGRVSKSMGVVALLILMIGGGITLGLEVVSIHMLAVVAGNSVYAFGLMLATFLAGLGVGSVAGKKLLHYVNKGQAVILAQCGVCISIIITCLFWDKLPDYFASFGNMQQFHHINFWSREIIRGVVCALAMFPAAFFIGMNYPSAMSLASTWLADKGEAKAVGIASALNTFGNISGVLLIAFVFLPMYGSNRVFLGLAILAFLLACVMWWANTREQHQSFTQMQKPVLGVMLASLILFTIYPTKWDLDRLSQGANVYFFPTYWGEIIDHTESISGGITAVAKNPEKENELTLLTNGKFQGNNTGEVQAQESIALIPLMHTHQRDNVLVIGYGTGMSARVMHEQHFKQLDIVELSKDIVLLADKYFPENNKGVSQQKNVNMYYTDGRNYLLTQDKKYDLISLEISSIWFAGAANLYNKEFYQLAKKRLNEYGILQQWIQLHHIHPRDLIYVLNTVRSEFKYIWLYESGGQGIIVASNSEQAKTFHPFIEPYHGMTTEQLMEKSYMLARGMMLTPEGIDNLAKKTDPTLSRIISTDNNLYLEYATPKGNAINDPQLFEKNIKFLTSFEPQ